MRVGLFGGSFDPIHRGHLDPVREARAALDLDRVIFLPTAQPPHKTGRQLAPALMRYAMVELALLHDPALIASPHELTQGRTAYTVETVEHFRRELPQAELFVLVGSDSFVDLPQWVRWRDIVAAARIAVLRREGWNLEQALAGGAPGSAGRPGGPGNTELAALVRGGRVETPPVTPCDVSSTRLRQMLARGARPPVGWLPDLVVQFIDKYRLYR